MKLTSIFSSLYWKKILIIENDSYYFMCLTIEFQKDLGDSTMSRLNLLRLKKVMFFVIISPLFSQYRIFMPGATMMQNYKARSLFGAV